MNSLFQFQDGNHYHYINNFDIIFISQSRGYYEFNNYNLNNLKDNIRLIINMFYDLYQKLNSFIKNFYGYNLQYNKSNNDICFWCDKQKKLLDINQVPGSLINILFILVPIYYSIKKNSHIILIDEIELSLDELKMNFLLKEIKEFNNAKYIITTHNKNIISNHINDIYFLSDNKIKNLNEKNNSKIIFHYLEFLISNNNKFILVEGITDYWFFTEVLKKINNYYKIKLIYVSGKDMFKTYLDNYQKLYSNTNNIFIIYDLDKSGDKIGHTKYNIKFEHGIKNNLESMIIGLYNGNKSFTLKNKNKECICKACGKNDNNENSIFVEKENIQTVLSDIYNNNNNNNIINNNKYSEHQKEILKLILDSLECFENTELINNIDLKNNIVEFLEKINEFLNC